MNSEPYPAVFDCVIYAQAFINPRGPSGACLKAAETGDCLLQISEFVLREIRELPSKLPARFGVTIERIDAMLKQVCEYAVFIGEVPEIYVHPSDPDDSPYINLALVTRSELVVSRDRHLLALMDHSTTEGKSFVARFPGLHVVKPVDFLRTLDARREPPKT